MNEKVQAAQHSWEDKGTVPQAVFFDLYETLITEFNPGYTPGPTIAERLQINREDFSREWIQLYEPRMRGLIPDFLSTLREICNRLHLVPSEEVLQDLFQERVALKKWPFQQVEGRIVHMLRKLREETTVRVGVITNATAEEVVAWDTCALSPFFDDSIVSCQVGTLKPDAAIYHLACDRLNVSPEASCFIGDGGSDELVGAKAAGLWPYWATWFLDRWPHRKLSFEATQRSAQFPRLKSPMEVLEILRSDEKFTGSA